MVLTASVRLRRGRFDAGGRDDRHPEFVPSPFRLFCALVAVAAREGDPRDRESLRWLESQEHPTVFRPPLLDSGQEAAFFVTNRTNRKGGSMSHPGRGNIQKHRSWVSFRGDQFHFVWNALPPASVLSELQALAAGVDYFGRVESAATVSFSTDSTIDHRGFDEFRPARIGEEGHAIGAPYSGALDELVAAHERGASAWEVTRWAQYTLRTDAPEGVHRGPFDRLLVFAIDGRPIDGSHLLDATSAFRAAVMSRIKEVAGEHAIPPSIHGHDGESMRCAYIALPFVGFPHADAGIRGFALALPGALSITERSVIGQALTGPDGNGLQWISYARGRGGEPQETGRVQVRHVPFPDGEALTLRPSRWMAGRNGRRTWETIAPAMLDRYPKRTKSAVDIVRAGLVRDGFPEPSQIEVSRASKVEGSVRYRGSADLLRRRQARPLVHVRVTFPVPVTGPVIIGSLRYLGGGLCIPVKDPKPADPIEELES